MTQLPDSLKSLTVYQILSWLDSHEMHDEFTELAKLLGDLSFSLNCMPESCNAHEWKMRCKLRDCWRIAEEAKD